MLGKLFEITTKYNNTYNILIVLNILFFLLAWDRPDLHTLGIIAVVVYLVWLIFNAYIAHNNKRNDWIGGSIYANYTMLNLINTIYIVIISGTIGYGLYSII